MKTYLFLMSALLSAVPAGAQSPPPASTAAPLTTAKPCDPIDPEMQPNGDLLYTGCQIKAIGGSLPKLISAPKEPDLSELYRQGIQGVVVVILTIGKDGLPRNATVKVSSRSPELDAIGVDIVNNSIFSPAKDRDGKPVDARAIYPTEFWKDSIGKPEFMNKSCAQFLIDAGWHQANFPDKKPDQYRGWLLATGLFFAASMDFGSPKNPSIRSGNRKTRTYAEVVEICQNSPDKPFFHALTEK